MAFVESPLNKLTPSSIYKVSREDKDKLNKVLVGYKYYKLWLFRLNIKTEKI